MANATSCAVTVLVAGTARSSPAPQVDDEVGGSGKGAGRVVGDGNGTGAPRLGLVKDFDDLRSLPRLAHGDEQVAAEILSKPGTE